jgi:hypothetical protein
MDAHSAAFFEFRAITQTLHALPVKEKTLSLEYELFHALERAHDSQCRVGALETRQEELQAESEAREQEQDAFARQLHADLRSVARELQCAKIEHERELHAMWLKVLSAEARGDDLAALCRSLVATIERAATCREAHATAESEPSDTRVPA